jgi:SAM-dependent methyltransferase
LYRFGSHSARGIAPGGKKLRVAWSFRRKIRFSSMDLAWKLTKTIVKVGAGYLLLLVLVTALVFPHRTDPVVPPTGTTAAFAFYAKGFAVNATAENGPAPVGDYAELNQGSAPRILPKVTKFAADYGLQNKRVLEVGSGTGYLQDVVPDYVGLDISPTAARFYHKPFVQGSATDLPFKDGDFDVLWTIYVLEHVPHPEQALAEMRRVVKNDGLLYLMPAWYCVPWAAEGYPVRPYKDFGIKGKVIKATVDAGMFPLGWDLYFIPARLARGIGTMFSNAPTRFHYILLQPEYDHFWMPDSDAVNALDSYEMERWFSSRGDECLNCGKHPMLEMHELIIRIHKSGTPSTTAKF